MNAMLSWPLPNFYSNPSDLRTVALPTNSFQFLQSLQRCFVHRFRANSHAMFDTVVVNQLYDTIPFFRHVTLNEANEGKGGGNRSLPALSKRYQTYLIKILVGPSSCQ